MVLTRQGVAYLGAIGETDTSRLGQEKHVRDFIPRMRIQSSGKIFIQETWSQFWSMKLINLKVIHNIDRSLRSPSNSPVVISAPGPPLSQSVIGSRAGPLLDSKNQKKR